MASEPESIVIVGAGPAGHHAAAELRRRKFDGKVTLIGNEGVAPYQRPPLSKEFLAGDLDEERLSFRKSDFYEQREIETLFGDAAEAIHADAAEVELASGERLSYDRLLIATGTRNRTFPIPGLDKDGVFDLRTVADSKLLREQMERGKKVVIVGMGFIGSEVAATMAESGLDVTALDFAPAPLAGPLGETVCQVFTRLHEENGVKLVMGQKVKEFKGGSSVSSVTTEDGQEFECDFAVAGLGVQPNHELAEAAGLEVENGIVVDEFGKTSDERIFAAGDVANHYHPKLDMHMRVEHHMNALNHGAAVARAMIGQGEPYAPVHTFWSDQYGLTLDYAGHHSRDAEVHVRGSLDDRDFVAFYVEDGIVTAVANMGRGDEFGKVTKLMGSGELKFSDKMADDRTNLDSE